MEHESFERRRDRRADERVVRLHQGRSRGAAGYRSDLHERGAYARRAGRLANDDVPDAGLKPFLGRHVFSAALPHRHARVSPDAVGSSPTRGRTGESSDRSQQARDALIAALQSPNAAGRDNPVQHRRIRLDKARCTRSAHFRPIQRRRLRVARPSFRIDGCWTCCWRAGARDCDDALLRNGHLTLTQMAAGRHLRSARRRLSLATRSTTAGWCRTSRRCCTTTRSFSTCLRLTMHAAPTRCTANARSRPSIGCAGRC